VAVTESSTPPVKAEAEPDVQARPTAQMVFITVSGKKYHADGCRYLSKSKVAMALRDPTSPPLSKPAERALLSLLHRKASPRMTSTA